MIDLFKVIDRSIADLPTLVMEEQVDIGIYADPECKSCDGRGVLRDDYLFVLCNCVEKQIARRIISRLIDDYEYLYDELFEKLEFEEEVYGKVS